LYFEGPLLGNNFKTNKKTISAARQHILNMNVYAGVTEKRFLKKICFHGKHWNPTTNSILLAIRVKGLSMGQV
jgi:hypothetical protein